MPERQTDPEAEVLGRFEPTPYDLGITDDPEAGLAPYEDRLGPAAHELYGPYAEWDAGSPDARAEAEYAALGEPAEIGPYPGSDDPERLAQWCGFPSMAAMEAACEADGRELAATSEAEARWEAECEALAAEAEDPEAARADDLELEGYPTFDDDPARWGLLPPEPMTEAEVAAAAETEAWGPRGPFRSYAEYLAETEPEAEP